mgnify:CR=1 FL=1
MGLAKGVEGLAEARGLAEAKAALVKSVLAEGKGDNQLEANAAETKKLIRLLRRKAKGKADPEGDNQLAEAEAAQAAEAAASEASLSEAKHAAFAEVFVGHQHNRSDLTTHPVAELTATTPVAAFSREAVAGLLSHDSLAHPASELGQSLAAVELARLSARQARASTA